VARDEYSQRLDRAAAAVSEDASCVGQWHVDRVRAESGPRVTAAEAREALERQGVRVLAELPKLPGQPPMRIARHPDFTECVARLGRKLSIELVFGNSMGGFSILDGLQLDDGRRPDRDVIEEARRQTPADAAGDDWQRVLSVLADAAGEQRGLDDIVFWEIARLMRELAGDGSSQRVIAEQASRWRLARDEAEVLAAAVAVEHEILLPHRQSPFVSETPEVAQSASPEDRLPAPETTSEPAPPRSGSDPPPALRAVTDLQVRPMPGRSDIVQLSWSPPPAGIVTLRMAAGWPPWPRETAIASRDADTYGRPLDTDEKPGPDGRMSHELTPLPTPPAYVTAITVRDAEAVIGSTVEVTKGAPVQDLSWLRFGEEVRLSWKWPAEAIAAYVAWQPVNGDGQRAPAASRQQRKCTRRAYETEGGFAALMGRLAQRVEVWAVFAEGDQEVKSAPAEVEVPAIGPVVRYSFRRVGLPSLVRGRRRREVVLSCELPCVLPDLVIVESAQSARPLGPDGGKIVKRIPSRSIDPSTPERVEFELDPHSTWVACFIDPGQPPVIRNRVTLMDPPVEELRVR
jgi:hypothetical protein